MRINCFAAVQISLGLVTKPIRSAVAPRIVVLCALTLGRNLYLGTELSKTLAILCRNTIQIFRISCETSVKESTDVFIGHEFRPTRIPFLFEFKFVPRDRRDASVIGRLKPLNRKLIPCRCQRRSRIFLRCRWLAWFCCHRRCECCVCRFGPNALGIPPAHTDRVRGGRGQAYNHGSVQNGRDVFFFRHS